MELAKDYANTIARRIGLATAALTMAITVFAVGGWPAFHWWLMVVSAGFFAHSVAYAVIFTVNGRPYVPVVWADDPEPQPVEPPENKQVVLSHARPQQPEPETPEPLAAVLSLVEDRFVTSTKWRALGLYLQTKPAPAFSRSAMIDYMDQRFYSRPPGEIYTTFPELMIRLKVARPDGNSYQWRDAQQAASLLNTLSAQVNDFYPTLPKSVTENNHNGGYNRYNRHNRLITGGRGDSEVAYE